MVVFLIVLLMLAAFVGLIASAPWGWEDQNGFHYGMRDDDQGASQAWLSIDQSMDWQAEDTSTNRMYG